MVNKTLSNSEELKLMIIENFIDYFTSNEMERRSMKRCAEYYVDGDHVNELEQFEGLLKDKLA